MARKRINRDKIMKDNIIKIILNNDLEAAKDLPSNLTYTNQFGEPCYLIAKRLGYDELSEILYQHTSDKLTQVKYLTSPVQVLYSIMQIDKNEYATSLHKAAETYAFNPFLAKLLMPLALEHINESSLVITNMKPQWIEGFEELGVSNLASHIDLSNLIDYHLRNEPIPLAQNIIDTGVDFFQETGVARGIIITKFDSKGYGAVDSSLNHELTHEVMRLVFKGETSVPYSNEFGMKCSKKTYANIFSNFAKDLNFINSYQSNIKKTNVEENRVKIVTIDKSVTPSGNELSYTVASLKIAYNLLQYIDSKIDPHEEAVAFYAQSVAANIPDHHMTFMKPIEGYYKTCILPAIEEFVTHHQNCHLIQWTGTCASLDTEL